MVVAHARTRSLLVRGGVPGRKPGDDARVEVFEIVRDVGVGARVDAGERTGGKPGRGLGRGRGGRASWLDTHSAAFVKKREGLALVVGIGRGRRVQLLPVVEAVHAAFLARTQRVRARRGGHGAHGRCFLCCRVIASSPFSCRRRTPDWFKIFRHTAESSSARQSERRAPLAGER